MNDTLKQVLLRFGLPILASSVVIGLGSAVLSSIIMNGNLETRVSKLENTVDEEKLLSRTAIWSFR